MGTTKRLVKGAGIAAGVTGMVAAARRRPPRVARPSDWHATRAQTSVTPRRVRPASCTGSAGHTPDPNVSDDILADRIRSSIGPLEKRLDLPHVHVMVEDKVVILHGDVPATADPRSIEHAIMGVSGVRGIESHLHAGAHCE